MKRFVIPDDRVPHFFSLDCHPTKCQEHLFIKQTVSEEKIFKDFFENMSFLRTQQPMKISDQDEGHLKRRALLNKHFSKIKLKYLQ